MSLGNGYFGLLARILGLEFIEFQSNDDSFCL